MDRVQVLERLEPIADVQLRNIIHQPNTTVALVPSERRIAFRPGGGARMLDMSLEGMQGLASFIGLQEGMIEKLQSKTLVAVMSELLAERRQYSLIIKAGVVIGFNKPARHNPINVERMLRTIESAVPGAEYTRVLVDEARYSASIEIVGTHSEPVVQGDLIRAGAMVAFSPINTIVPEVQAYVLRLMCTNGVTTNDVLRKFDYGGNGGGENFTRWLRQSIRDSYRAVGGIVTRWRQMIEEELRPEDRAMVLETMIREAGITKDAAQAVRNLALREPPNNTYDIINLISWASSHLLESPRQVMRARQAVANFTERTEHQRICPVCHRGG